MTDEIRVLHVDGDPSFLEVVATYLEKEDAGLTVVTAASAPEALDLLAEGAIDCVVSEYELPGTDGLSFLESIREDRPELPFVLYTGHGSEAVASEAISAGVTDYVQKETGTDQYAVLANVIRNAVEHRQAEAALEESERRYRTLVEQSHDGIYIYQGDSFLLVNDRVCEITGYDRERLHDMEIWDLVHPDDRERLREFAARRRAGEDVPSRYQARIVTADGAVRHLEFSVNAITYRGEHAGIGSVRDVTDRHRQEQRLDEFASIVAHDLRNPLNVIAGRIELAAETGDDTHFEAIERGVENMEQLISDMRDLAEEGVPVHEAGVVEVSETAEDAAADVEAAVTVTEDLPTVEADPDRLERLLTELLDNAVRYGGEDVSVRVEALPDGFAVVDDGPGIDENERDRVFEAGYTTDPDRTGFGLAVVEWIADAHGWEVAAAESDGDGVAVRVTDVTTV